MALHRRAPLIVCGAGCAGLSLVCALLERGYDAPVVVLDRRSDYADDRTWCFWDPGDLDLAHWADHAWPTWTLRTEHRSVTRGDASHPYRHLGAGRFYARALSRAQRAPNVELRLDTAVTAIDETDRGVRVSTSAGTLDGALAFDALASGSPARAAPGDIELRQVFLGQFVRTERPVFDPDTAVLMDFRTGQGDGAHFLYVLAFAPDRALVEDTHFHAGGVGAQARRAAIAAYLDEHLDAGGYDVEREESGVLPMSTARLPERRGRRIAAIGMAGGAIRPSSGYAFVRIQRQAAAHAEAVVRGRPLPGRTLAWHRQRLDAVFLDALRSRPERFGDDIVELARRAPAGAFARFMSDASSPLDEALVAAAAPLGPFAAAAGRRAMSASRHPFV